MGTSLLSCKGPTVDPTSPFPVESTPTPTPTPPFSSVTPTPGITPVGGTPTPTPVSGDNYGDTPYDPNIKTLIPDDDPYVVTMDYTGDIDWYKVSIPYAATVLHVSLVDIPARRDFDVVAYNSNLVEMRNGRSAESGNASEYLTLSLVGGSFIYLQIYSYSGSGKATLILSTKDEGDDEPGVNVHHLTYEEILSTYYSLYPRGSSSSLLEHSIETTVTREITCRTATTELQGTLTIGNYAHVERDLFEQTDYIDGWALVVFDGPTQVLEELTVTIRVTIPSSLGLDIQIPIDITKEGSDYLISNTGTNVYYLSESYGNFWSNSRDDIRLSSHLASKVNAASFAIFTQQIEVEWSWSPSGGRRCSGRTQGTAIVDFELTNAVLQSLRTVTPLEQR